MKYQIILNDSTKLEVIIYEGTVEEVEEDIRKSWNEYYLNH